MKKILKEVFGYENFRYPQEEIIETIVAKKDCIAILPTGAGKSLTFQIPALYFANLTIIISPLISLMIDQVNALKKKGIKACYLNSTLNEFETNEIYSNLSKMKLIYVSPEKLLNKKFITEIQKNKIDFICIDEAHTLLWGLDFREAFLKIYDFIKDLKYRPVISAVTATATKTTIDEIKNLLKLNNPKIFKTSFDRPNLFYQVKNIKNKDSYILEYLLKNKDKLGIIYALTCKNVEKIYNFLLEKGFKVTYYHGQLNNEEKKFNQKLFLNDEVNVMVCTISFGMGIDKPNIRYVINYDMPSSIEDYVQMAGRASRDGKYGECTILYNLKDLKINEYFIGRVDKHKKEVIEYKYMQLREIYKYCKTKTCLHKYICNYFEEKIKEKCNNCQKCKRKNLS